MGSYSLCQLIEARREIGSTIRDLIYRSEETLTSVAKELHRELDFGTTSSMVGYLSQVCVGNFEYSAITTKSIDRNLWRLCKVLQYIGVPKKDPLFAKLSELYPKFKFNLDGEWRQNYARKPTLTEKVSELSRGERESVEEHIDKVIKQRGDTS